jgi:chromosome segregation ATPase
MNINEQLTCKHCKEIFNEPVTLNCCGINICKRHIDELLSIDESNTFLCPFCDTESANQHFCINGLIQTLVQNKLHKLEMNSDHKVTFNSLKAEIEKLEAILKDPENIIYEEISELKRLVDLDRERTKRKIDELANNLIQKLEAYEARFKAENVLNLDLEDYNALLESSRKQMAEYEKFLNLFATKKEERKEMSKQTEKAICLLQNKTNELKSKLFSNLSLTYKSAEHDIEEFFGELLVKVSLYLNSL